MAPTPAHFPGGVSRPGQFILPEPGRGCSVGTGGTLAGIGMHLERKNPAVRIAVADPMGAVLYNWYKHGELEAEGSSITEGTGRSRITQNLEGAPVDDAYPIADAERVEVTMGTRTPPRGS